MKKIVLAMLAMFATAGLTLAAVVTLVKCDDKKITVKDADGKETSYDIEGIKFIGGKDGKTEMKTESVLKLLTNEKMAGKLKLDITVEGNKITEAKMVRGGKKKKDKN